MKKKQFLALVLALLMILNLCACGSSAPTVSTPAETAAAASEAAAEPEATPSPADEYVAAEALLAAGKYDEAADAFAALGDYEDAAARIPECRYEKGVAQIRRGEYAAAEETLKGLDYADSEELLKKLDAVSLKRALRGLEPGNTFTMGAYEQDADESNGPEPIDWLVIGKDEKNDRLLALSYYCLDSIPFNNERGDVKWATSSIRAWLNSDFYENVFSDREKEVVLLTRVDNSEKNPDKGTPSGPDTDDYVFFLSYDEFIKGLVNTGSWIWDLQSWPTEYAKTHGAAMGKWNNSWWWLRTAGKDDKFIMYVNFNGIAYRTGFQATHQHSTIRPAIWVDISEDIR